MNSLSTRLRALAVTVLAFGLGTLVLAGLLVGVDQLPALAELLPGPIAPIAEWPDMALDIAPLVFLVAIFLIIGAVTLTLGSRYLDRMFEIFADVLLMVLFAKLAIAAGAYGVLVAQGAAGELLLSSALSGALPLAVLIAIVAVTLALAPHRARRALPLRVLVVLALLAGAPFVIATPLLA